MGLNFGGSMLSRGFEFGDDGKALIMTSQSMKLMESAVYTESVETNAGGSPVNMYDDTTDTEYLLSASSGEAGNNWAKWDLGSKKTYKTIYVTARITNSGGGTQSLALEGSNDDSSWTTISSFSGTGNPINLLGSIVSYRYLRLLFTRDDAGGVRVCGIFIMKAVE